MVRLQGTGGVRRRQVVDLVRKPGCCRDLLCSGCFSSQLLCSSAGLLALSRQMSVMVVVRVRSYSAYLLFHFYFSLSKPSTLAAAAGGGWRRRVEAAAAAWAAAGERGGVGEQRRRRRRGRRLASAAAWASRGGGGGVGGGWRARWRGRRRGRLLRAWAAAAWAAARAGRRNL
nr:unnamed protein product [Digitaria exilis]